MRRYVVTYGVACAVEEKGRLELVSEIPSITTKREKAERIVNVCNEQNISPEHLPDVVEDMIEEE